MQQLARVLVVVDDQHRQAVERVLRELERYGRLVGSRGGLASELVLCGLGATAFGSAEVVCERPTSSTTATSAATTSKPSATSGARLRP